MRVRFASTVLLDIEEGRGCRRFECPAATFSATRRSAAVSSPVEGYSPVRPASLRALCPARHAQLVEGVRSLVQRVAGHAPAAGAAVDLSERETLRLGTSRGASRKPPACCPPVVHLSPERAFRRFLADERFPHGVAVYAVTMRFSRERRRADLNRCTRLSGRRKAPSKQAIS